MKGESVDFANAPNRPNLPKGGPIMQRLNFKQLTCWALCGLFAISSLACLRLALLSIWLRINRHYSLLHLRNLGVPAVLLGLAIIFGMASWTGWKEERSARVWGIIASLASILLSLWSVIFFSRPIRGPIGILLIVGIAGAIAFSWPTKRRDPSKRPTELD